MKAYERTIISQYYASPILNALISTFNACMDPRDIILSFYNNVINLKTAVAYGLDVWGRIVGVSRTIQAPTQPLFFGFLESLPYGAVGFGQGPFWNGVTPLSSPQALSDPVFRTLILAKGLANITSGSCADLNKLLLALFPNRGNCYVVDNGNMTMTYVFKFALTEAEYAIVSQTGVLPRPPGVAVLYQFG